MNVMALVLLGEGTPTHAPAVLVRRFGQGGIDEYEYTRRTAALPQVGHPGITG